MRIQDKIVAAVLAHGGTRIEPAPSKRYIAMDYQGERLWIGKLGAIRRGKTIREAKRKRGRVESLYDPIDATWENRSRKLVASGAQGGWDDDGDDWYYQ